MRGLLLVLLYVAHSSSASECAAPLPRPSVEWDGVGAPSRKMDWPLLPFQDIPRGGMGWRRHPRKWSGPCSLPKAFRGVSGVEASSRKMEWPLMPREGLT